MTDEIRAIGTRTTNAQLMADCAALGYLPEPVFDATYEQGRFWQTYRPTDFLTNDLAHFTDKGEPIVTDCHYDFRHLPWTAPMFGTVVLDPPYKLNGTSTGRGPSAADARYGVGGEYRSVRDKHALILDGIVECARVTNRYLLVKCQDQVCNGVVHWQTMMFTEHAAMIGLKLVDMLHVQGYRKQPDTRKCSMCAGSGDGRERLATPTEVDDGCELGIAYDPCLTCDGTGRVPAVQQHARRDYSTLLVLEKGKL